MPIYDAIGYKLLNTGGITALVGNRVYHGEIPETENALPVINYFEVTNTALYSGIAERPRYQISCRDNTPDGAEVLAVEVIKTFNNIQETINGFDVQGAFYDSTRMIIEPDNIYNCPVDLFLLHVN